MKCIIPGSNIKIMSRALQALAKISDELYIEAKKEYLQLAVINMSKTAYTTFHFLETFFSSYEVAEMEPNSENVENLTCKIHLKPLLIIFRMKGSKDKDKNVELCKIELRSDATKMIVNLKYRQGMTIVHSLRLIDMEFVTVSYSTDNITNQISAPGHFFTKVMQNFQISDDDMSLEVDKKCITVRNYDVASTNIARCLRSQVVLNSTEFTTYNIKDETNVTVSFKPFRAAIHFAEILNLNIVLNFETGGKPLILIIKSPTFEVNFILSTINPSGVSQTSVVTSKTSNNKRGNVTKNDRIALDAVNWDSDVENEKITNNKMISTSDENEEVIPQSPESPRIKRLKTVFGRCFEPTFHPSMLDLGEELAPNSDSDSD